MKIKLSPFHFEELMNKSYSFDHLYLLLLIRSDVDISEMCKNNQRIDLLYKSLIRKGLLSDEGKITLEGRELLDFIDSPVKRRINKIKHNESDFDKWWSMYPASDFFEYKGRKFSGFRTIRQDKEGARVKFNDILSQGKYTAEMMIQALEYTIKKKLEGSIKTNTNQLTFLPSPVPYLRKGIYETVLQEINENKTIDDSDKFGPTDI